MLQEIERIIGNARCKLIMTDRSAENVCSHSHAHTNYELFYVWNGTVEIITEEQTYALKSNQAALIAPGQYHQTYSHPGAENFSVYFSFTCTNRKSDVFQNLEQIFSGVQIVCIDGADDIGAIVSQLRKTRTTEIFCYEERLQADFTKLLLTLYDYLSENNARHLSLTRSPKTGMQYRYEIDSLLANNFTTDFELSYIAKALCLSEKRVSEIIKSLYGKSFRQVKTEMRIQLAKQLLRDSEHSVTEIGAKVGYRSKRGFLIAFECLTGKTPTQYRILKKK